MNSSFSAHQQGHLNGDNATHPIEPRWRTPAALLLLALGSPQRRRPCRPQSSQRLAFFALFRCARAHLEPQRSALPAHPIAAARARPTAVSRTIPAVRGRVRNGVICAPTPGSVCPRHTQTVWWAKGPFWFESRWGVILRALRGVAKPGWAAAQPWVLRLAPDPAKPTPRTARFMQIIPTGAAHQRWRKPPSARS